MPIPFIVDPLRESGTRGPARGDRWIDRWLAACADLAELKRSNPMTDAVIDEIDGRMIRIGDQWLADFASCNYLGFDLDARDHRRRAGVPAPLGHPPQLVAAPGQPGAVRADREPAHGAPGMRGLARAADHHPHPHVGDPRARRRRHDLPRQPGAQDDLRRLPGRPGPRRHGEAIRVRGSRRPRPPASRRPLAHAHRLHGRREQHHRQRARPARVRPRRARARRAPLRRRRPRVRRHRRAERERDLAVRHARQQHRPALRRVVRGHRPRRRLLEGVLVAGRVHRVPDRSSRTCSRPRRRRTCTRARRPSRRSRPCSRAST